MKNTVIEINKQANNQSINNRNIGIDILRLLAMLFVVILHVIGHGGIWDAVIPQSPKYYAVWGLKIFALCAVNCYAIISGYVLFNTKFKYHRIINLWIQVALYSVLISALFFAFSNTIGIGTVINSLFPVINGQYWYFTAYFALFFLMPFINKLLQELNQNQTKALIISLIALFSVVAIIARKDIFSIKTGHSCLWLAVMYIIGAYFKKYGFPKVATSKKMALCFIGCAIISWLGRFATEQLTIKVFGSVKLEDLFIEYNSPTILLCGIFLFLAFANIKNISMKVTKIVETISVASFGVYLIQEHPLIYSKLMDGKFAFVCSHNIFIMLLLIIISSLAIYFVCIAIDLLRVQIFKWLKINKFSKWLYDSILHILRIKEE